MFRVSVFAVAAGALLLAGSLTLHAGPASAGEEGTVTVTTTQTQTAPTTTATASSTAAQPSGSPSATATPEASVTGSPTVGPPPLSTTFPEPTRGTDRVLSTDFSLPGRVFEEKPDGEQPTHALVELQLNGRFDESAAVTTDTGPVVALFTDEAGQFRFTDIPPGEHLLWAWGGLGWVNLVGNQGVPSVFIVPITVSESGVVSGAIPDTFVMREKPEGVLGYPIRTGLDGLPPPTGSVSVRAFVAQLPGETPPLLPAAGARAGGDGWREASAVAVAAVALLAGGVGIAARSARRRN